MKNAPKPFKNLRQKYALNFRNIKFTFRESVLQQARVSIYPTWIFQQMYAFVYVVKQEIVNFVEPLQQVYPLYFVFLPLFTSIES